MKVLVTGGSGFIGSHLIPALVTKGHEVTILDNLVTSLRPVNSDSSTSINFVEGSILDERLVARLVCDTDQVVHLAAAVGVANIVSSPLRGLQTNVLGSEIVIRNSSTYSKPILLTSSSEVYGKNESSSLNELSDRIVGVPQVSRWSYSDSKAIEEAFAIAYHKECQLPIKIVRLFNTVGPGQLGDYGMVIPRLMRSAIRNEDLQIYGDGEQMRCFMHVLDAVQGIIKFLEIEGNIGQTINLGNPEEISIRNLAEKIISQSKSNSKIKCRSHEEIFGKGFEDMRRRVPDITKASTLLDWVPEKSLDHIIEDVYNHEILQLES
jgi:UDP-glucose 4-epimerase